MSKCSKIHVLSYHDLESKENLRLASCFDYIEIDNKLSELQRLVDGLIEPISICQFTRGKKTYSVDLVCNDEGKLKGLPYNAIVLYDHEKNLYDYIAGQYFLALCDVDKGDYIDLPNEYVEILDKSFCCAELSYLDGSTAKIVPLIVCQVIQKDFQ